MKMIYPGKTKNVYALENGNYRLFFKDDMTFLTLAGLVQTFFASSSLEEVQPPW